MDNEDAGAGREGGRDPTSEKTVDASPDPGYVPCTATTSVVHGNRASSVPGSATPQTHLYKGPVAVDKTTYHKTTPARTADGGGLSATAAAFVLSSFS